MAMETAKKLTEEIRSGLVLSHLVVHKEGAFINVGEHFTIRFICSNFCEMTNVVFKDPRIFIAKTQFARPGDGEKWYHFADKKLAHSEKTEIDIDFIATDAYGGVNNPEDVARVIVYADLDLATFFSFGYEKTFKADIQINT